MEWIIAGIFALLAGTAGAIDSVIKDKEEYDKKQREMDFIEDMYELDKKDADTQFNKAKDEANKNAAITKQQADLTDKAQDITETALSADFNTAIDDLYLSQANDTWSWNASSINAGASTGNALAGLAASGVRGGSSLNDAVLMESSLNSAQLQFSQDAKRRSDSNNLAGVLNNLAGNQFGIMENRIGADISRGQAQDLVNSYLTGGYNYNLYKNNLDQLETKKKYQYNEAQTERDKHAGAKEGSANRFWNATAAFFGMGTKGFETGYDLGTNIKQGSKPKYKTTVEG